MVEDTIFLPLLVAIIGAISAIVTAYVKTKGIAVSVKTTNERITVLETKMELFWDLLKKNIAKVLHSPHTPELDALLDKLVNKKKAMAQEEMHELKKYLEDALIVSKKEDALAIAILLTTVEYQLTVET